MRIKIEQTTVVQVEYSAREAQLMLQLLQNVLGALDLPRDGEHADLVKSFYDACLAKGIRP